MAQKPLEKSAMMEVNGITMLSILIVALFLGGWTGNRITSATDWNLYSNYLINERPAPIHTRHTSYMETNFN